MYSNSLQSDQHKTSLNTRFSSTSVTKNNPQTYLCILLLLRVDTLYSAIGTQLQKLGHFFKHQASKTFQIICEKKMKDQCKGQTKK